MSNTVSAAPTPAKAAPNSQRMTRGQTSNLGESPIVRCADPDLEQCSGAALESLESLESVTRTGRRLD